MQKLDAKLGFMNNSDFLDKGLIAALFAYTLMEGE